MNKASSPASRHPTNVNFKHLKFHIYLLTIKIFVQKKKNKYYPAKCLDDLDIEKQFLFHNHNKKNTCRKLLVSSEDH